MTSSTLAEHQLAILHDQPFLRLLPDETRRFVAALFEVVHHEFGEVVVREGDDPDALYVVLDGSARVLVSTPGGDDEVALALLHPGDSFGEAALVERTSRRSTVRAAGALTLARLDRRAFDAALHVHPEISQSLAVQVRVQQVSNFIRTRSALSTLPLAAVTDMVQHSDTLRVEVGELVVRQGDDADAMFVVEDGRLRAFRVDDGVERNVDFLRAGDVFGELALASGERRAASVEAVTGAVLLRLDRATFERLLAEHPTFRARVDEHVAARDLTAVAPIPLDFTDELLPTHVPPGSARNWASATTDPAFAEAVELEVSTDRPVGRRRFLFIRQLDAMDCAAACLAMVCASFGRRVAISHIRRVAGTSYTGTTLHGIRTGGAALGLDVELVKSTPDRIATLPTPSILHWDGNHWVVLHRVKGSTVGIADPGRGKLRMSVDELAKHWSGYAAVPTPTPALQEAPVARFDIGWLLPFARPLWKSIAIATLLSLVASIAGMVQPAIVAGIVDDVLPNKDWSGLWWRVAAMVGFTVVGAGIALVQGRILAKVAHDFDSSALGFLTDRMLSLPLRFFQNRRTSDLERRLGGLRELRRLVVDGGIGAITSVTRVVVALVLMFLFSVPLALLYLATVPLFALFMGVSSVRLRPIYARMEHALDGYAGQQLDTLRGIETVKTSGAEEVSHRRLDRAYAEMKGTVLRGFYSLQGYGTAVSVVGGLLFVLFSVVGAVQVMRGDLTIGQYLAFNSLVAMATGPALALLGLWDDVQSSAIVLQRLADVLEEDPEQPDAESLRPVPSLEGAVRLDKVSFRHQPDAPDVLIDVTLDIAPGTSVGIVGRSGSGKSTLLRLIAGLVEPTSGSISYDGVPLGELRYAELRRRIGFVLQQPYLFDATIAENIAFGAEAPDIDEVERAATIANAADFIERLPMRYATRVGDAGLQLSGGQAQRVAIARAVYGQPPVLLLDEATSALDSESERIVKDNLEQLLRGRTAFVVAHRLSTIRDADLIVVMDAGRVVETGTHEELLRREGLYAYLHAQQLSDA